MLLSERLHALLEPVIVALGYELVLLEYSPQANSAMLRLFIDGPEGITLDDCERVSREVAGVLDVEDPIQKMYQLEISSPGVDRPLTKPEHYLRFEGEKAKIQVAVPIEGRKKFVGRLAGITGQSVRLETDQGLVEFELTQIEKARLVPDFKIGSSRGKT